MSSLPSDFFFFIDIILVEKIDIYLFKLFVRIYLLLYDCNLMLSDDEYNLLTYLTTNLYVRRGKADEKTYKKMKGFVSEHYIELEKIPLNMKRKEIEEIEK